MSKNYLFILILLVLAFIGGMLGRVFTSTYILSQEFVSPVPAVEIEKAVAATPVPIPVIGNPKMLSIPKLGVQALVELVGMDKEGRMGVPENFMNVAWYSLGFKPGERGSAVIAGHLDDTTGAPAIFYNLNQLVPGDEIIILDDRNQRFKYLVSDKKLFDYNDVPLREIFASTDKARLNLITCGGSWDRANKNYTKRTVIYTELVD